MDKRVILAVAGSGKTYHICHMIDPSKRNLLLAFTNENIHNIRNELCDAFGSVPELTTVMTFDSFMYRHLINPYEPSIAEHFNCSSFASNGICTMEPPPKQISISGGRMIANRRYTPKDKLEHYITESKQYYCANLSELAMQVKKGREYLVKRAAARLNLFYDQIFIDEFQDFREHDFDLIMELSKHLNSVLLVGDYYQHSVSGTNNSGKPFKIKKNEVCYNDFVATLKNAGFEVDEETLRKSRRCATSVCNYVKEKLGIQIESANNNQGEVLWCDDSAEAILDNPDILKLVIQKAADYKFNAMNWSYSKGDTFSSVCVILTDKFDNMDDEEFTTKGIATSTINKLYVAMTRSKGNLYLMKSATFKKMKDAYIIK